MTTFKRMQELAGLKDQDNIPSGFGKSQGPLDTLYAKGKFTVELIDEFETVYSDDDDSLFQGQFTADSLRLESISHPVKISDAFASREEFAEWLNSHVVNDMVGEVQEIAELILKKGSVDFMLNTDTIGSKNMYDLAYDGMQILTANGEDIKQGEGILSPYDIGDSATVQSVILFEL